MYAGQTACQSESAPETPHTLAGGMAADIYQELPGNVPEALKRFAVGATTGLGYYISTRPARGSGMAKTAVVNDNC